MASTTENLGLTLPAGSENVSRSVINSNMTIIDTAFGDMNDSMKAMVPSKVLSSASATTHTINIANNVRVLLVGISSASSRCFAVIAAASASGSIATLELVKGSGVTIDVATANKFKVTFSSAYALNVLTFAATSTQLAGATV